MVRSEKIKEREKMNRLVLIRLGGLFVFVCVESETRCERLHGSVERERLGKGKNIGTH